jgi:hypothetical protein
LDSPITKSVVDLVKLSYGDLLQPAASEVGAMGGEVAAVARRTVNAALSPIRGLLWSFEQVEELITENVGSRLAGRNPDEIITPAPNVAVPVIQSLLYCSEQAELREMYCRLLATSMDKQRARMAHPAYPEIIRQLTPDEARILRLMKRDQGLYIQLLDVVADSGDEGKRHVLRGFSMMAEDAQCEHPDLVSEYTDNLCRLGLCVRAEAVFADKEEFIKMQTHATVAAALKDIPADADAPVEMECRSAVLTKTHFCLQFLDACVDYP